MSDENDDLEKGAMTRLAPFNPANIGSAAGFALAIIFNVQALTGWEGAAPLAEETTDPKRNVPRSVILSIVLIGVFLVFVFYGLITGFGVNDVSKVTASSELPAGGYNRRGTGETCTPAGVQHSVSAIAAIILPL